MAARSPHKGLSIGTYENDSRQHGKVLLCTVLTFDHAFVCKRANPKMASGDRIKAGTQR